MMDRDLAIELEREASPHYYHMEDGDAPGAYLVPARLFDRVVSVLRGDNRDSDWGW